MLSWQLSAGVAEFLVSDEMPVSLWTEVRKEYRLFTRVTPLKKSLKMAVTFYCS